MASTRGTLALKKAGVNFTLHPYDYDPNAEHIGLAAAAALGLNPATTLKTLMIEVDGKPACVVIPSDASLSMKKAAAAFGGKQAAMMPVPKAERLSGYHVGGIGPFGQMRPAPVCMEESVAEEAIVHINAGQRGLLLGINPQEALAFLKGKAVPLVA